MKIPARVKCNGCGREAWTKIVEDSPDINAFECEPDWKDEDQEEPVTCEHDDWEVIDVVYDPPEPDDVI